MDDYKRAYEDVNLDVIKNNVDIIMKRTDTKMQDIL